MKRETVRKAGMVGVRRKKLLAGSGSGRRSTHRKLTSDRGRAADGEGEKVQPWGLCTRVVFCGPLPLASFNGSMISLVSEGSWDLAL